MRSRCPTDAEIPDRIYQLREAEPVNRLKWYSYAHEGKQIPFQLIYVTTISELCSKPAGELKLASFGPSMPAHGASMSQGGGLRQEKAS